MAQISKNPGPVIGYAVTNQLDGEHEVEILLMPGMFYIPKAIPSPRRKLVNGEKVDINKD